MENEIVPASEVRYDLGVARAPKQVIAEAQEAAKTLHGVISQRKNAVKFNGKHYLSFEDWQTCGRFYGVTAKVVSTEFIDIDGTKGFIARAEAINTQTGQIVSAAESMCMGDEPNWTKKPLFQLRSMAQTRAAAKSLRNVLAWVVVLAGYEPNVAEEMTGDEQPHREPIKDPEAKPAPKPVGDGSAVTFVPAAATSKDTSKPGQKRYAIKDPAGEWYSTFDDTLGAIVIKAKDTKALVRVTFKIDGTYKNIVDAELA